VSHVINHKDKVEDKDLDMKKKIYFSGKSCGILYV
jgi:hypothetical protein